jgi:hypothetical protein
MKKRRNIAALAAAFTAAVLSAPLAAQELAEAAFLSGTWTEKKDNIETDEMWLAPKGGIMLGVNRTVLAGKKSAYEFMRIELRDGRPVYLASPGGRPPVEFKAIESSPNRLVFENRAHDYPQRVIYVKEGNDLLLARIEGTVEGRERSQEWRFVRVKQAAP